MECSIRGTDPAFYDVCVRASDNLVLVRENPGSHWRTISDESHYIKYQFHQLLADVLQFSYEWNLSFLERKWLITYIEGLRIKDERLLKI